MEQPIERWREIAGYDHDYDVSDLGRVRSRKQRASGKILVATPIPRGYMRVGLCAFGKKEDRYVHDLVLETFVGPRPAPPPGHKAIEARHLDGNPANNALTNLAWGTSSENKHDRVRHGRDHNTAKTHCKNGHPFDLINTQIRLHADGTFKQRQCMACHGYGPYWEGNS